MNNVGVPRTSPEAIPLRTSRRTRSSTRDPGPVAVEQFDVEPEVGGVLPQVTVIECLLAVKEHLVHVPEPVLKGGRLGGGGRGEGVRMDLGEREMPEREPDVPAQFGLHPFDGPERLPRVWAFVVAVLNDQGARRRAPDVVDRLVQRLQQRSRLLSHGHAAELTGRRLPAAYWLHRSPGLTRLRG